MIENALGQESNEAESITTYLLDILTLQGRAQESAPYIERKLASKQITLGPTHPEVVALMKHLGDMYLQEKKTSEAEKLYKRILSMKERALGKQHPDVASSLTDLGQGLPSGRQICTSRTALQRLTGDCRKGFR